MSAFPDKLAALMRHRGETTRSLGAAVGASSAAVTGWTKGARPHGPKAKALADYFGVTVDELLDDTRDLPADVLPPPRPPAAPALAEALPPSVADLISELRFVRTELAAIRRDLAELRSLHKVDREAADTIGTSRAEHLVASMQHSSSSKRQAS